MGEIVQATLAWTLAIVAALSLAWDVYDLLSQAGNRSVTEYIRGSVLCYPAAIAIGALVASHFARWPW